MGASSGLGAVFLQSMHESHPDLRVLRISRKSELAFDFSKEETWNSLWERISEFKPDRLFYFAGGGPWGPYPEKKWSSHLWTYRVNLLLPAYLLSRIHEIKLLQAVFVGSAIAESKADPWAASYASSKHGLLGLISTLQAERSLSPTDLRLFSPGYLDTPLLPAHAPPRAQPGLVQSAEAGALALAEWIAQEQNANGHLRWPFAPDLKI